MSHFVINYLVLTSMSHFQKLLKTFTLHTLFIIVKKKKKMNAKTLQ